MKANWKLKSEIETEERHLTPPEMTLALARTYAALARSLQSESYLKLARCCISFLKELVQVEQGKKLNGVETKTELAKKRGIR